MAKILFMNLAEPGHLNASLKAARTLKARGHRVTYATLAHFQDYILSQGLELIPLFETLFPRGGINPVPSAAPVFDVMASALHSLGVKSGKTGQDLLGEEIDSIIRSIGANLVIIDSHLAVRIPLAVARIACPYILMNATVRFPIEENSPAYRDPKFARILKAPTLFLCPEEFDFPHSKKRDNYYYAEANVEMSRKETDFPWDRVSSEKKLIYCSLGTQAHWSFSGEDNDINQRVRRTFLQNVIDVAADEHYSQLVLSISDHLRIEDFSPAPSNVILVNAAPQLEILRRASVMITHGGLNTIKECILFGAPMIVFPMRGDQYGNAARVAYHRIGVCGHIETATMSDIQGMLNLIRDDPTFGANMGRMSRLFKIEEEAGLAVNFIESTLNRSGVD
jgi:UDP:flavonoid glycosyltransferase YjiC (YdhE family)